MVLICPHWLVESLLDRLFTLSCCEDFELGSSVVSARYKIMFISATQSLRGFCRTLSKFYDMLWPSASFSQRSSLKFPIKNMSKDVSFFLCHTLKQVVSGIFSLMVLLALPATMLYRMGKIAIFFLNY